MKKLCSSKLLELQWGFFRTGPQENTSVQDADLQTTKMDNGNCWYNAENMPCYSVKREKRPQLISDRVTSCANRSDEDWVKNMQTHVILTGVIASVCAMQSQRSELRFPFTSF